MSDNEAALDEVFEQIALELRKLDKIEWETREEINKLIARWGVMIDVIGIRRSSWDGDRFSLRTLDGEDETIRCGERLDELVRVLRKKVREPHELDLWIVEQKIGDEDWVAIATVSGHHEAGRSARFYKEIRPTLRFRYRMADAMGEALTEHQPIEV
jgi:hypothetical protein